MPNVNTTAIGMDVGGSHISAAIVNAGDAGSKQLSVYTVQIDARSSALTIIKALAENIKKTIEQTDQAEAVGIAFPGPFNYPKGVSAICNVGGKFEKTFGLHMQQALKDYTGFHHLPFKFFNDAHCFASGAYHWRGLTSKRTIFITLGTGFGSAFMLNGELINLHPGIPASGAFYDQEFNGGIADDFFSTRWILKRYLELKGTPASSVKEIAEEQSDISLQVMQEFGSHLGRFLLPWLIKFGCDELLIGGNIARAFGLFSAFLKKELARLSPQITILQIENTEACIMKGAALLATKEERVNGQDLYRKSLQASLPLRLTNSNDHYNIYPSFASGENVYTGFDSLAEEIRHEKLIIIDGYTGVLWELFREKLHRALLQQNKNVLWFDVNACLKPSAEIEEMIAPNLNGNDPVFGKKYTGKLQDFFDLQKLKLIQPDPDADTCIIYGTGAALTGLTGKFLYIDAPKNEIQFRMRAGSITNLGAEKTAENFQMYKRFYFVDWPVLNRHKALLLPRIDIIIDEQRIYEISWMKGDAFRNTLQLMLQQPFRARPWFEAGVWGGDWMKKHIPQLNQDEINYAWSFELISPENGIVIEGSQTLLEVSFDYLLYADHDKLLGKAAKRFVTEFPIRFDFLDTFHGGNLSIQCHPRPAYIRERFGENFTQDETYYILDCEADAVVYLGFKENIEPDKFEKALIASQDEGIDPVIENYVQKLPAHKHDLFLIPNGTIHASGKNNLVLEISSTPYIFTFKMYDWMRPGLNGLPRPINIEHGMNNVYFDRKGGYVQEKLVSHPVVEQEWPGGKKIKLPTHEEHFYQVTRYEFTGSITINTNNHCHVCMLVEGKKATVIAKGKSFTYHYAETFIVPAAVNEYEIHSTGQEKIFIVVAHVKDEHC